MHLAITTTADLEAVTRRMFRAGMFQSEVSEDMAFAILYAGLELGIAPPTAARNIALVKGRVSLSADLTVGLCLRHGRVCEYFRLTESTDARATYETRRAGSAPTTLTYTIEQARRAGLVRGGPWQAHPEAMLRARCAAALARAVYPDLVAGIYDPDEGEEIERATVAEAPAQLPDRSPLTSLRSALPGSADPARLAAVVEAWHAHAQALHDDQDAIQAALEMVADWLDARGYRVTATEQQRILARGWSDDAMAIADDLARRETADSVRELYVAARATVEAQRDPSELKRLFARSWGVLAGVEPKAAGKAFAALLATGAAPTPAAAPAAPEPIITSKGEVLDTREAVEAHCREITALRHLESAARKHGAHPWAREILIERASVLVAGSGGPIPRDEAAALVDRWAAGGAS